MDKKKDNKPLIFVLVGIYIMLTILSLHMGNVAHDNPMYSLMELLNEGINRMSSNPLAIFPLHSECFTYFGIVTTVMAFLVAYFWLDVVIHKHDRAGKEHGDAHFDTDFKKYNKECSEPQGKETHEGNNMILTQHLFASMDQGISGCNNNILAVGGSGCGKTYSLIKPNVLQCNASLVITDPNGEILNDTGYVLESEGFKIKVLDLVDMSKSNHYNPLRYIREEEDVISLVTCLIKNTSKDSKGGDPFWEMSETALLESAIFYLIEQEKEVYPKSFAGVMTLLSMAEIGEGNSASQSSPLDALIFGLEAERKAKGLPCMAAKQYRIFKQAGSKTAKSILISASVRLSSFNFPKVAALTNTDDMELEKIGDEKTALFIITPTGNDSLGVIPSIMYSQLFDSLYYHAEKECEFSYTLVNKAGEVLKTVTGNIDNQNETKKKAEILLENSKTLHIEEFKSDKDCKYLVKDKNGEIYNYFNWKENAEKYIKQFQENITIVKNRHERALPIYTRFLMDEFANIGQIPNFQQKISTTRKYLIGLLIILQNISQLDSLYKDDAKTIIGNCDYFLYLGGKEPSMLEYMSKALGETTIRVKNTSVSRGKGGGNMSFNQTKAQLMTPEQIGTMGRYECILQIAYRHPFKDKKFDLKKHERYKLTGGKNNPKHSYHFVKITDDLIIDEKKINEETEKIASSYYESQPVNNSNNNSISNSYSSQIYKTTGNYRDSDRNRIFTQTEAAEMARQSKMENLISESLVLSSENIAQSFAISSEEESQSLAENIILNDNDVDDWDFTDVF